jgi:hypothetical protein
LFVTNWESNNKYVKLFVSLFQHMLVVDMVVAGTEVVAVVRTLAVVVAAAVAVEVVAEEVCNRPCRMLCVVSNKHNITTGLYKPCFVAKKKCVEM